MSDKWADYLISAVRNDSRGVIQRVRTHQDSGGDLPGYFEETRAEVIRKIKAGYTYMTIFKKSDGKWYKGQPVFIITVHGVEYIKTISNSKEEDNLDDLPAF